MLHTLIQHLALLGALSGALWAVSLWLRDASIVDRFWGAGFVVLAGMSALAVGEDTPRVLLLLLLVSVWGLRLSAYITWRNWGHGEDRRYAAMRAEHGSRFIWRSLWTVFLLQGLLVWIIGLPIQIGMLSAQAPFPVWTDLMGVVLAVAGIAFETIADAQMARFKSRSHAPGAVMDRGLWRYSRHPNYFGDALAWWGFYLLGCGAEYGVWLLPCPLLMTWLLRRVSGVPMLEEDLVKRRPDYAEYIRRTPAFVPWFPKKP